MVFRFSMFFAQTSVFDRFWIDLGLQIPPKIVNKASKMHIKTKSKFGTICFYFFKQN